MAKQIGTLVYTGKHNERLNITRTVYETIKKLNIGNVHPDFIADELALQDANVTRQQILTAFSRIAHENGSSKFIRPDMLMYIGNNWYKWGA